MISLSMNILKQGWVVFFINLVGDWLIKASLRRKTEIPSRFNGKSHSKAKAEEARCSNSLFESNFLTCLCFLATKLAFDLFHRWSSCHTTTAGTWCPTRGKTPRRLTTATSCRTPTLRCRQRRWRRRQCPWPSTTTATCWPQVRCRTENWTKNLLSSGRCWETRTMEISSLCELCLALIWPAEDFLGCQQQQLLWCAPREKIFFCSVLKCNFLSHPHRCSLFIFCINSNNNNNSCNSSNNSNNNCFNCSCSNSSRSNVFIAKQSGQAAEFLQSLASPPEFEIRLWTFFSPCHCFSRDRTNEVNDWRDRR